MSFFFSLKPNRHSNMRPNQYPSPSKSAIEFPILVPDDASSLKVTTYVFQIFLFTDY